MLIPFTVAMMDASPKAWWLGERSTSAGYVVVIVSDLFGGQGEMRSYYFAYPPRPKVRHTLLVATHSVGYRGGGKKGEVGTNDEEL